MLIKHENLCCGKQGQAFAGRGKEFPDFVYKGEPNRMQGTFLMKSALFFFVLTIRNYN